MPLKGTSRRPVSDMIALVAATVAAIPSTGAAGNQCIIKKRGKQHIYCKNKFITIIQIL